MTSMVASKGRPLAPALCRNFVPTPIAPSVSRGSRKSLGLTLLLYISLERLHVLGRTSSCVFGGQRRNQRHQFDPPSSCFRPKPKRNHRTLRNGLEDPLCLGCPDFCR